VTKKTKKITLFVYSRRATQDPHHTWHADRGDPSHFCTPNFFDPISSFASGAIENLRENNNNNNNNNQDNGAVITAEQLREFNTPQRENAWLLVPRKRPNYKKIKLPGDAYKC